METGFDRLDISVLYVEDDQEIALAFANLLGRHVRELRVARDGSEGLSMFEKYRCDAVITDVRMPKCNGMEMARKIKEEAPSTPVIITSAFTDTDYFLEAIECNVDYYLLKPIDPEKLHGILARIYENIAKKRELVKTQNLLHEYKKAVDLGSIVVKTDTKGVITYVNAPFCELSGYGEEELLGETFSIVRHPNTRQKHVDQIWETILKAELWRGVIENRSKSGDSFFLDMRIVPIINDGGEIEEFISMSDDISELIHKEHEIEKMRIAQMHEHIDRAAEIKTETILNAIPLPAVVIDGHDIVQLFNARFEDMFDFYHDREILDHLKSGRQKITELFEEKEGYLYDDKILDWKYFAEKVGHEEGMVHIKLKTKEEAYRVVLQRLELPGEEIRYLICFSLEYRANLHENDIQIGLTEVDSNR